MSRSAANLAETGVTGLSSLSLTGMLPPGQKISMRRLDFCGGRKK